MNLQFHQHYVAPTTLCPGAVDATLYLLQQLSISFSNSLSPPATLYLLQQLSISSSNSLSPPQTLYLLQQLSISSSNSLSPLATLYLLQLLSISSSNSLSPRATISSSNSLSPPATLYLLQQLPLHSTRLPRLWKNRWNPIYLNLLRVPSYSWKCMVTVKISYWTNIPNYAALSGCETWFLTFLIRVSPCILTIQQYLLHQMHNLIIFSVNWTYMLRPIRPSSGQQSLGIPRIQFVK
jgi:hypothetical protein